MSKEPTNSLSISELRKVLRKCIRTSADFAAFCLDYFPDVQQRLTSEMDGLARENLLLSLRNTEEILQRLRECCPEGVHQSLIEIRQQTRDEHNDLLTAASQSASSLPQDTNRVGKSTFQHGTRPFSRLKKTKVILGCLALLFVVLCSAIVVRKFTQKSESDAMQVNLLASQLLSSEPEAEIVFHKRRQGRTPFELNKIPPDVSNLCLLTNGYQDQIITLQRLNGVIQPLATIKLVIRKSIDEGFQKTPTLCQVDSR